MYHSNITFNSIFQNEFINIASNSKKEVENVNNNFDSGPVSTKSLEEKIDKQLSKESMRMTNFFESRKVANSTTIHISIEELRSWFKNELQILAHNNCQKIKEKFKEETKDGLKQLTGKIGKNVNVFHDLNAKIIEQCNESFVISDSNCQNCLLQLTNVNAKETPYKNSLLESVKRVNQTVKYQCKHSNEIQEALLNLDPNVIQFESNIFQQNYVSHEISRKI